MERLPDSVGSKGMRQSQEMELGPTFVPPYQVSALSQAKLIRKGVGMPSLIMQLPEFTKWVGPLIVALKELGGSARPREVVDRIAKNVQVPDEVLDALNPSGGPKFPNQVHWARFYLAEDGYLDRSKHGVWKLTEKGDSCPGFDESDLRALVRRVLDQHAVTAPANGAPESPNLGVTSTSPVLPAEADDEAPAIDDSNYQARTLSALRSISPGGFERLCQRLLREAGFEQVVVTGKSNDGGIDGHGILSVNPFVSFRVLFQCKRYAGSVSPAHVRDFRGAMQGRADKGIIITTGSFTSEASREASRDGAPPIELVDSERLVNLLAKLELGLRPVTTYEFDENFFFEYK